MFRLYSKGCEYAIRALVYASSQKANQRFSPKDVCKKANIPESYTRKIFQNLVKEGLFDAASGPGGGYRLTKHPKDISVLSIIEAIDGDNTFDQCVMGLTNCDEASPCPLHKRWKTMKQILKEGLKKETLEELMALEQLKRK